MIVLYTFIFFILGTIFGSFANVVILRYHTGRSFMTGRSHCFSCGKTLEWYELIPLFSYLFLGGKCLSCGSKISAQYPIVEGITGILFAAVFLQLGFSAVLPLFLATVFLLVVITVYDLQHMIIPDSMVYLFDAIAFVILWMRFGSTLLSAGGYDLLAGPILFAFFAFFWLVSKGQWMGLGDAKLALGVGWLLGLSGGIFAIMISFWIGATWSLLVLAFQRLHLAGSKLSMKSEIPFAPFIILATAIQFFTLWNMSSIIHLLG